jgi:hypothetical protein
VLIASSPKVRDPLARKKRNIAPYARANSAFAELAKLLAMLLAIEDRRFQCCGVEVRGDRGQAFEREGRSHEGSSTAIKGERACRVVDLVVLDAF